MNCPRCQSPMQAGSRFCEACGQAVAVSPPPPAAIPAQPSYSPPHPGGSQFAGTAQWGAPCDQVMTMGGWFWTLILLSIPIVNLVLLLVWSLSSGTNRNKQNFARATILLTLLGIVFYLLIFLAIMGVSYFA